MSMLRLVLLVCFLLEDQARKQSLVLSRGSSMYLPTKLNMYICAWNYSPATGKNHVIVSFLTALYSSLGFGESLRVGVVIIHKTRKYMPVKLTVIDNNHM